MRKTNVYWIVAAFFLGAFLSVLIRGAGTSRAEMPSGTLPPAHSEQPSSPGQHAHDAAKTTHPMDARPLRTHPQASAPGGGRVDAPPGGTTPGDDQTQNTVFVCSQDHSIGLSYPGACPLDGQPMVEAALDLSTVEDLENKVCPVMGGETNAEVFALYKGKKVRFCCQGCDRAFFENPEGHLAGLER